MASLTTVGTDRDFLGILGWTLAFALALAFAFALAFALSFGLDGGKGLLKDSKARINVHRSRSIRHWRR